MPKMEKGRPPESKRSRKPAHPVKREVSQEMKSFAENTMNELLGWYGYDKEDLPDSEASDVRSHPSRTRRHHVSVLKENSDPKPAISENKLASGFSAPVKNRVKEYTGFPLSPSSSLSSPHMKDLHSTHVVVPVIKPSAVDEQQNVQIVCVWCQKEGLKRYSLVMGSELKSFCSEKCFAMCRRAYFKRNKARNEDRQGNQSPPPSDKIVETPSQFTLKMNNNTRVCDWCKHVRHSKYLDLGAGEDRLQFCSTKCLNQYKMDIFYREARAALTTSASSPSQPENESPAGESENLLTPESWNNASLEGETKETSSPKVFTPLSSSGLSSFSSSSSVRMSVLSQQKKREGSGSSQVQPSTTVPCVPPPHTVAEQPWVPQKPPGFNLPHIHSQPRNPGSSPTQRTPSVPTTLVRPVLPPQILHSYPTPIMPCVPTYPQPVPSFMPTLGLPCPQTTVLVPYPIIVPLPIPVPIPIPIPVNSGMLGPSRFVWNSKEGEMRGTDESDTPEDVAKIRMSEDQDINDYNVLPHKVKTERTSPESSPILSAHPELSSTPVFLEVQREDRKECKVIQRVICQVKQEDESRFGLNINNQKEVLRSKEHEGDSEYHHEHQSPKYYRGSVQVPLSYTSSSPLTHTSSPTQTLNTHSSIIVRKAYNNSRASIVTPTASVILNNTTPSPVSMYSSTCISSIQSDPEHRTSPTQIVALSPDFEAAKENVSEDWEPGLNSSNQIDQTDCPTGQSEESKLLITDSDALTADEHTYARSIPPKLREKNAHTITLSQTVMHKNSNMHASTAEQSDTHTEIEPALKRRCLRIRDQNK
ncbi:sine oculis-binding protein homolog B [Trichomycterus rosablanca]|uniref:sine oculis-binding protein homolog B n=1 Tax=Trichomycterus rosablanca TaxID=2290929 RepID=UPI002F357A31